MQHQKAFSLVELSIVLVILGLLTGGILAGQSLIRASELRSVTTQYSNYVSSVQSFRDKYFALPGDMPNATRFWGVANATPATCRTTASTSALTCDGDGSGVIADTTGSTEHYRFWQHLANAGLIEGSYSGITQGSTATSSTSANSPAGKISSTLWFTYNWGAPQSGNAAWFDGIYGNRLSIGGTNLNGEPANGIFRPEEVWNIDTKMDDGKPGLGKVMTQWPTCTGATSSSVTDADYALTTTTPSCFIIFRNSF